jgi:nucleoside-diphosphate-sugar epimerase
MVEVENGAFALATKDFVVTALRQATVFGLSRRMRFDLVVNTMVKAAVETRRINVTGGGSQWRPLVHVRDTANAFLVAATAPTEQVNGRPFNIGAGNYRVRDLAETVKASLPFEVEIAVLPETNDHRSYSVSFDRAKTSLGFVAERSVAFGVREVYDAMAANAVDRGEQTITVGWYKRLIEAEGLVRRLAVNGRML